MGAKPMERHFSFISVGQIVDELRAEGIEKITRTTFYRLEKKLNFPPSPRTYSGWRSYDRETADQIKNLIKAAYGKQKIKRAVIELA